MKGIVFNLLEEVVTAEYGEEAWDSMLEEAQVEGAYTAVGSYPDEELIKLVDAASSALEKPADDVVRWFGRKSIPLLNERYPRVFEGHTSTRSFLLTLNDVIHPEVRKLFPGADVPVFHFEMGNQDQLVLGYASRRRLCSFAEGLIEGAAEYFGERVRIEQPDCTKRGDPKCILLCSFAKAA